MMKDPILLDDIPFNSDEATELTLRKLSRWIVWQFPRLKGDWLCGAVHPPMAEHGWLPAHVHHKKRRIKVYANVAERFTSPEAAAEKASQL